MTGTAMLYPNVSDMQLRPNSPKVLLAMLKPAAEITSSVKRRATAEATGGMGLYEKSLYGGNTETAHRHRLGESHVSR